MNLDIEYIHRWSLGMDLRILLKTALVVMRGGGE
jgi:lipopolysaccharide/colanic/teichoic acid biosynthesis glycosyltransferase